jgi:TrmH family RNA methyltransferase
VAWVEGERLCASFAQAGGTGLTLVLRQGLSADRLPGSVSALAVSVWQLTPELFDEISTLETSPGWGLIVSAPEADISATSSSPDLSLVARTTADAVSGLPATVGDVLILDRIQDPGNAGAILRSAAAAGVAGVWPIRGTVDLWSPRVLRAAMGAHVALRISAPMATPTALSIAAERGLRLLATANREDASSIFAAALDLSPGLAWVFGQEGEGVDPVILAAGRAVVVPQTAGVESLNVAAAAAVCLFEVRRRRTDP